LQVTTVGTLPTLAPASAAIRLFNLGLVLDFGRAYSVRVPRVVTWPACVFVDEGQPAPVVMVTLAGTDVGPLKKVVVQAAVTVELEQAGPETASAVVARILAQAITRTLDGAVFSANAATPAAPAGLLNGLVAIPAATGGSSPGANMNQDLGALASAIANANVDPLIPPDLVGRIFPGRAARNIVELSTWSV
jgi:hypothetical protein